MKSTISQKIIKAFTLSLLFILIRPELKATHIVGGQMSYTCLGNNRFAITLVIQRDCNNGDPDVYFDKPALIAVYTGGHDGGIAWNVGLDGQIELPFQKDDTIRESPASICASPGQEVCVHQTVYNTIVYLPPHKDGYIIAYQRCCRNRTISNIIDPLETGATYAISISAADMNNCNSNPLFGQFPPLYTCVDRQFVFDHAAIDKDGDSLVYSLCLPNLGGTITDPKGTPSRPPYDSVKLKSAYSLNNILNPNNTGVALRIDPHTGLITGTPNTIGQFLVGVCVTEYRNGIKMSYSTRDFELNIVPCGTKPISNFDVTSNFCSGLDQTFKNNSKDATNYCWYFDYPNNLNLTSTLQNPNFKFPKQGIYTIVLVAKNGSCTDTFRRTINVAPALHADFNSTITCLPNLKLIIEDKSTSTGTINSYTWNVVSNGLNLNSNIKNPSFDLAKSGSYMVKLIITDSNNCQDTLIKTIEIKGVEIDLINNTFICNGDSIHLVINGDSRLNYTWSPTINLNLKNPYDPIASPKTTTTYKVTVSDGNCSIEKEVTIEVKNNIQFKIIGDTTSCDGTFNFMAMSDSMAVFEWSYNPNFVPVIFTGSKLIITNKEGKTIYVRTGGNPACPNVKSIPLHYTGLDLTYSNNVSICENDSLDVRITNHHASDIIKITWKPASSLVSGQGTLNPKFQIKRPGSNRIYFMAQNQYGCMLSDSIDIIANPNIIPDILVDFNCGNPTIKVNTSYVGSLTWNFGDGSTLSHRNKDEHTYAKSGKYIVTLTADTSCGQTISKSIDISLDDLILSDSISVCINDDIILNPNPNLKYKYRWSPDSCFVNPNLPNPTLKHKKSGKFCVEYMDTTAQACIFKKCIIVNYIDYLFLKLTFRDTTICNPDNFSLFVDSNYPDIIWCDNAGKEIGKGSKLNVVVTTDTSFIVKGINGNCAEREKVTIHLPKFNAIITGPLKVCPNDTIMLQVEPVDTNWVFSWFKNDSINLGLGGSKISTIITSNTKYSVKILDKNGCEWTLSHTVEVSNIGTSVFATAVPSVVGPGEKSQLMTINNPNYTYKWEPNDSSLNSTVIYNPIAMPTKTTTYSVTVTDENGCTGSGTTTVTFLTCDQSIFVPSAFSPNGDQHNEIFRVRGIGFKTMKLMVYNRWGEEIFKTTTFGEGWDGTYKGKALGPDVFAYYVVYTCPDEKVHSLKGNVSLLK